MDDMIVISTRVSRPVAHKYAELAEESGMERSKYVRDALYSWLDKNKDVNLTGTLERVVKRRDKYLEAEEEKLYYRMENKRVSNAIKRNTFESFMDNFMAQIYLSNHGYKSQSELEELLRESLEALRDRAEFHDKIEAYEARRENPVEYTEEYLDRKSRHDETFSDKFLSDM